MNHILFSVAVVAYNNYEYIFETIDSILQQDYPCMELVISDDASKMFDEVKLKEYIETNKKNNLVAYSIWKQPENLGTVANVEFCRTHAKGQAFYPIAADDILDNSGVISCFVKAMEENPEAEIFSGHAKMYDELLQKFKFNWTTSREVELIRRGDSEEIFSRLSNRTLIPTTGTCYRMSLFERLGGYNTAYRLIEDAPLYLKAARSGAKFHWIDGLDAGRHRAGGLCHSQINYKSPTFRRFTEDRMGIFKKEVFPYLGRILSCDIDPMITAWYATRNRYENAHSNGPIHKMLIRLRHTTVAVVFAAWLGAADGETTFSEKMRVCARFFKIYVTVFSRHYLSLAKRVLSKIKNSAKKNK